MEQNLPIISKKIWKMVRVLYFMLRKNISKAKLFSDVSMMIKRGKLAGKSAIQNLIFHHHHHHHSAASFRRHYDFHLNNRKHSHEPPQLDADVMAAALEIFHSASSSPFLPGFGPSPVVRQLRVTDSPFPLRELGEEDYNHVDEAAEEFIMKFYKDLKRQNSVSNYLGCS